MTKPTCDICEGTKRIRLPRRIDLDMVDQFLDDPTAGKVMETPYREFDCPQCTKLVPFRRVRAVRVVAKTDFANFGKYQNPIERGLAQQFGAYLHREGLIKFSASNLADDKGLTDNIDVAAEINVVVPADARDAEVLVVATDPPPLPRKLSRQEEERQRRIRGVEITTGYSAEPVPWSPQVFKPEPAPKSRRERLEEARSVRSGITDRFAGLDLGDFEGADE